MKLIIKITNDEIALKVGINSRVAKEFFAPSDGKSAIYKIQVNTTIMPKIIDFKSVLALKGIKYKQDISEIVKNKNANESL